MKGLYSVRKFFISLSCAILICFAVFSPFFKKDYTVSAAGGYDFTPSQATGAGIFAITALLMTQLSLANDYAADKYDAVKAQAQRIYDSMDSTMKHALVQGAIDSWQTGSSEYHFSKDVYNYIVAESPLAVALGATGTVYKNSDYGTFTVSSDNTYFQVDTINDWRVVARAADSTFIGISSSFKCSKAVGGTDYSCNFNGGSQHIDSNIYGDPGTSLFGFIAWFSAYFYSATGSIVTVDNSTITPSIDANGVDQNLRGIFEWSPSLDTPSISVPTPSDVNYPTLTLDGTNLTWDGTTSTWRLPDGSIADINDITTGFPDIAVTGDITADGTMTYTDGATGVITDVITGEATDSAPTGGTSPTDPSNPWKNFIPTAILLALLDLLRAVLMYLARMFQFIMTLPIIPAIPIDNEAFQWFREAEIIGIHIYSVVSSMATLGFSFLVFRSVRKVLGNA